METIVIILFLGYWILGYWATGETIYRNRILILDRGNFFLSRMIWGFLGGWILIPIALIGRALRK